MSDPSVTQNLSGNDGAGPGPSESTTETPAAHVEATPETPAAVVGVGSGSTQMPSQSLSTPEGNVPPAGSADVPRVGSGDAPPSDVAGDGDAPRTLLPAGSLLSDLGEVYTPPARPGVVRRERKKKACRKAGDPAGKRGKISWIWGTKLKFFDARKDEWAVASQKKIAGEFYIKTAKLYTVKYGFLLDDDEDFECDVADPLDWVANKVVNEQLTPEETKLRQDYHAKLRDRLGGWYRTQKPPRCPQLLHFYSEKRWDSHIKPCADERKRALERRAEMTGVPAPAAILIQNEVTKECWEDEPESLKEEMLREREREHEIHLKAWKESNADGPNRTPEEFSASLKSTAHYLQPFVDIIAEHYGMCVSILMVGPIGEHGGQIEMHSVHSGMTMGLVEKDWPLHDPEGFTRVQTSMVDFGHHVLSQAEREARMTALQEVEMEEALETSGAASTGQAATTSAGGVDSPSTRDSLRGTSTASGALPAPSSGAAAGTQADENNSRDNDDESGGQRAQGEGEGDGGGVDNEDSEDAVEAKIAKLWQRRDAGKWTEELTRAHRGFERGKGRGIEWAWLVSRFYNFEAAWGYTDVGGQITTSDCPTALQWWIGRGRKWDVIVDVGVLGDAKAPGTFIANWWNWWVNVQPNDRSDWAPMLRLHGKNGMLQIMASLLWWGEQVADGNPADLREWSLAIEDVSDTLKEMLRPGMIAKFKKAETKTSDGARGKKRKAVEGNEKQKAKEKAKR
ncbi:hypothetical protein DFH08DRAFT_949525 [Mycena albidolilacea]|uniref:Uncharacterized protein n=1 Tax=Mycena albidolilacea TaxID=1033008 RepID=A0AAD7AND2_9AGAR|nr:hypothetical protein DFH08DRAFT_949525 [Mycena albidolilacea]